MVVLGILFERRNHVLIEVFTIVFLEEKENMQLDLELTSSFGEQARNEEDHIKSKVLHRPLAHQTPTLG